MQRKLKKDPPEKPVGDSPISVDQLKEVLTQLNLATKQDLDDIRERISKLESR